VRETRRRGGAPEVPAPDDAILLIATTAPDQTARVSSSLRSLRRLVLLPAALIGSATAQTSLVVDIDTAVERGTVRDVFGVNRRPSFSARDSGAPLNAASLYASFGVSQVRTHDTGLDLCGTYTAATKLNTGVSPAQPVAGCELSGTGSIPTFSWTPTSSADADLNNPASYDFSATDTALTDIAATGASVYLRLGESYNGPNQTGDPVAWAKVATNIYRHMIGAFKPTAGVAAVEPVFVEVHNEPDGGFWRGTASDFHALFRETVARVRAAAAAAGRSVRIGGPGFTRSILTTSNVAGNPANGFVAAVGADSLDFYSAHHYGNCSAAKMSESASFLRSLRSLVDRQGGSGKPIHVTEWNIGLGNQCGSAQYGDPRMLSWTSGVMTLMQDPAHDIEAAHFYAGVPIMALFDLTTVAGKARVNPSAWAFWAHGRLRGATRLEAQVCQGASCLAAHASETLPLLALAARRDGLTSVVVTNDGSSAQTYTLRLRGLSASVDATVRTPPSGTQDVPTSGSPAQADAAALRALLSQPARELLGALVPNAGTVELSLTVPARSLHLVELRAAGSVTAQADCLLDWGERAYPTLLRPALSPSVTAGGYHYRYYSATQTYVGISLADQRLLLLDGSSGVLQDLGLLSTWLATASCS
jgi:hypothetical protein